MSRNVVERLRQAHQTVPIPSIASLYSDAADEIERLRAAANRTLNAFFCCNGLDNTDLMDAFSEWAVLMNHAAVPEAAAWIAKWEARRG